MVINDRYARAVALFRNTAASGWIDPVALEYTALNPQPHAEV